MNQEHETETAERIVKLLEKNLDTLDGEVLARLKLARNKALEAHTENLTTSVGSSLASYFGHYVRQHRVISSAALLCSLVFVGFIVSQQYIGQETVEQGDAFLLGSELPPEAYVDEGFNKWLAQDINQQ